MRTLSLSLRLLWRDARAGELHLLLAALIVAVGALTAVGFFTDRVSRALTQEAKQLLGADLLVVSDHALDKRLYPEGGLRYAETQTFPSMVSFGTSAQLADIKAAGPGYPLRGALQIARSLGAPSQVVTEAPPSGEVWIEPRLATALGVAVGDSIGVGTASLRVSALLTLEPDRGISFFSLAPRMVMALADVPATGLIQPGSRVTYRLLIAGPAAAIAEYRRTIEPQLGRGERIEDIQNARPELRQALERSQRFLSLAAMLGVVLSAVAIALAARRHIERQLDGCAVMRCLGVTQNRLLSVYLWKFLVVLCGGALVGCMLGWLAHALLLHAASQWLPVDIPAAGVWPWVQGAAVSLVLFLFVLPPLLQLRHVPPLRVLRRDAEAPPLRTGLWYVIGGAALAALLIVRAEVLALGLWVLAGFGAALGVFAALASLGLYLLARFRPAGFVWRHAVTSLQRHRANTLIQVVSLGLGFMAMLLLTVTRGELIAAWQRTTPVDAPNQFVINIQPDQVGGIEAQFTGAGIKAALAPMVRGRLMRVNGKWVSAADYPEERAARLVEREFNLSWRADLPPGNRLTAGEWFSTQSHDEASVEEGLAKTLGLKLGDALEFDIAGNPVVVRISSLRKLDWDSMRVNFFVLTPPGVLEGQPQSLITSFHLPAENVTFVPALVSRFPNLTVIDVGAVLRQLRGVIDQATQALQFVFVFTLAAGVLVLYAALANGLDARRREIAIVRALGATASQIQASLQLEFALVGGMAGLIAALGCLAVGEVLGRQVFQFDLRTAWEIIPLASVVGALLVPLSARLATSRLIAIRPLEALREA